MACAVRNVLVNGAIVRFPATSDIPGFNVSITGDSPGNGTAGMKVTTRLKLENRSWPVNGGPPADTTNVEAVTVSGLTDSLNVTAMLVLGLMPVAPLIGFVCNTCGGAKSAVVAVVNVVTTSVPTPPPPTRRLPATSRIKPDTRTETVVPGAKGEAGVKMTTVFCPPNVNVPARRPLLVT